jgi:hypothetical protein
MIKTDGYKRHFDPEIYGLHNDGRMRELYEGSREAALFPSRGSAA